jgi:hypothetical protein
MYFALLLCAVTEMAAFNFDRRKPREFLERFDPLESMDDVQLHKRFRFTSEPIRWLTDTLRLDIEPDTLRNQAIPA